MYEGNPGEIDFGSSQREFRVGEGSRTVRTLRVIGSRSYYFQTRNSDKKTEINISEFPTFHFKKCHVCLSFVIKLRKMAKLRQKLQISHFDVIRALRFFLLKRNITFSDLFKSTSLEYLASTSCKKCFLEFLYKFHSNRK